MSAHYSAVYFPPAPTLLVAFGERGESPSLGPFEAVVDTGADATIVPEAVAMHLQIMPLDSGQLQTQWGDIHPVTVCMLDLQIGDVRLPGIVVAVDRASREIVLGRNVLNKLPLFLDGPQQQTDVLDGATANRLRARR